MKFDPLGPFEIPVNIRRRVEKSDLKEFWDEIEEMYPKLSEAVGCYIFSLKNKSFMPWYVGLAEKQTFKSECFAVHKMGIYNEAISHRKKGKAFLTLLPKFSSSGRYSKTSKNGHRDIQFLEKILIGTAAQRNPELLNVRNTKFYRELVVPGLFNSPMGQPKKNVKAFKSLIGL